MLVKTPDGNARISIRADSKAAEAVITMENLSGTRIGIGTNIPGVVGARAFGFPTRAKLKLRHGREIIMLKLSNSEGWFSPVNLRANLADHDIPEPSRTILSARAQEEWRFGLAELPESLPGDYRSEFKRPGVQLKIALQFVVERPEGRRDPHVIETDWFDARW